MREAANPAVFYLAVPLRISYYILLPMVKLAALAAIPVYLAMRGVPSALEILVFAWLVAPILIGGLLIGAAAQIAKMLIGDPDAPVAMLHLLPMAIA